MLGDSSQVMLQVRVVGIRFNLLRLIQNSLQPSDRYLTGLQNIACVCCQRVFHGSSIGRIDVTQS